MMKKAISVALLSIVLPIFGSSPLFAQTAVTPRVLRHVVAFGASVTEATPKAIPLYGAFVNGIERYGFEYGPHRPDPRLPMALRQREFRSYGNSPIDYFVNQYKQGKLAPLS